MWQFLTVLLLFGVAVLAIKVAILLLILAGLIFRTKETIGLLAIGVIAISLYFKRKEKLREADQAAPELPSADD